MIPFTTFYGLHYNIVTWTPPFFAIFVIFSGLFIFFFVLVFRCWLSTEIFEFQIRSISTKFNRINRVSIFQVEAQFNRYLLFEKVSHRSQLRLLNFLSLSSSFSLSYRLNIPNTNNLLSSPILRTPLNSYNAPLSVYFPLVVHLFTPYLPSHLFLLFFCVVHCTDRHSRGLSNWSPPRGVLTSHFHQFLSRLVPQIEVPLPVFNHLLTSGKNFPTAFLLPPPSKKIPYSPSPHYRINDT